MSGYTNQEENNHEEADTLIIRCLRLVDDFNKIVNVYSADTDVFLLLLSHSNKINCQCLYIHLVKGKVDIKLVCQKLGNETSKALLSLHGLTGFDTTGKFEGKSKQFWFRRFLTIDQINSKLKKELADFQESNESTDEIESFFCRGYLYRSNKDVQKRVHKQLHSIPLDIHSSPRNSLNLKVKSCSQPKVHLNIISSVHFSKLQYGVQQLMH